MNIRNLITININNYGDDKHNDESLTDSRKRAHTFRSLLYKTCGIKCIIEPETKGHRMIIYSDRNSISCKSDRFKMEEQTLIRECHGLIIDIDTLNIICTPQKGFMYVYGRDSEKISIITRYYDDNMYMVHKMNDGTTLNLYWYNNKWVLSTLRGIEVNDMIWLGSITYQEILNEILNTYNEFSWNNLHHDRTYTIGFYHPKYHPFQALKNKMKAWFIQSADNLTGRLLLDENIGIPYQDKMNLISLNELYIKCNNELPRYQQFMKNMSFQHKKKEDKLSYIDQMEYDAWFGFVLKSCDEDTTGNYSHIICESSLYVIIKQLIYNSKHTKTIYKNNYDRDTYIVLRSYLDTNIHDGDSSFLTYFPQYTAIFERYHQLLSTIVDSIIMCLVNTSKRNKLSGSKYPLDCLTSLLLDDVDRYFYSRQFATRKDMKLEILKYIVTEEFIGYYYQIFAGEHKKILINTNKIVKQNLVSNNPKPPTQV